MSVLTLYVDEVMRTLSNDGQYPFVVNDKTVDIVRFALNTGFTDVVLDENTALRVMYQRPGETEVRAKTLTYYDTDGLRNYYDWHLLSADLAEKGTLTVALCILRTDNTVEEWHTTPCAVRVLGTIHTDDSDEADETITPTVAQRVAVLESVMHSVAGGAPVVVSSVSEMTDIEQIYVLSTDGNWYYHNGSAWVSGGTYGAVATDTTLTQSGIPADAEAVGDKIAEVNDRLDQLDGGGMTEEVKQALLTLVSHIGLWDDNHGQDYIDALEAALYPPASLTHITAVYTQSGDVYTDTSLDSLKSDLVVTAHYSGSTSETITAYTLSGTLTEGTSTITVSYGGKTTTFDVTVIVRLLPSGYQQLEYVYSEGAVYFESLVKPTAYPIRIEAGIYKASQANSEQAIITKKYGSSASLEIGYNATANTLFAYSGASAKISNPAMYGNVLDIVAEFKTASPYKTLDVTANEETLTAENTTANHTSILANNPLLFFGLGTTNSNYIGRMYYCKVYSGGELIGDFIPCYDKETGYAGLYETVGGTFHHSQGPDGFKRGGEV